VSIDERKPFGHHNAMVDDKAPDKAEMTFEQVLKKLEDVVARLERGDLSLDDSLKAYETGIGLVRQAQGRLDGMDKRLEELLKDGTTKPMRAPDDDAT
jgi:exodeoxyribonuclease VII small subunit